MTPRTTDDTSGLQETGVTIGAEVAPRGPGSPHRRASRCYTARPLAPANRVENPVGQRHRLPVPGRTTPRHLTGQAFPVYSSAPVPTEEPRQGKLVQASGSHMHPRVRPPLTETRDDRSKLPIHGFRLST